MSRAAINYQPITASLQVLPVVTSGTAGAYHGYHFTCTLAAVINIRDGNVSGAIIDQINVAALGVVQSSWDYGDDGRGGVKLTTGLYVEVVSGTGVVGSVKFATA
jgi:hypothetical protein